MAAALEDIGHSSPLLITYLGSPLTKCAVNAKFTNTTDIGAWMASGILAGTLYYWNIFFHLKTQLSKWTLWLNSATCLSSELFL